MQLRTTESSISTKLFNKAINRIYGAHLVKFIALRHLVESRSTISARPLYITCLCLVDKHNISPERALNSEYRSISIVIPSLNVPKPTRSRLSGSDQCRSIHLATWKERVNGKYYCRQKGPSRAPGPEGYGNHPPSGSDILLLKDMLNQISDKLSSVDKIPSLRKLSADPMPRDFNHTREGMLVPAHENTFGPRSKPYQIRNRSLLLGVTLIICIYSPYYLRSWVQFGMAPACLVA